MKTVLQLSRLAPATLALSFILPVPSPAQDTGDAFSELIDVKVVNVEVVVEDGRGRRVRGLDPADFRLLVDGEELGLEHFAEIHRGRALLPSEPIASATATTVPAEPPSVVAGQRVPNSYLIFVDDYFAIGAHRNLFLDQLARQLGQIEAPDQAAVVAFGGRDLELLSSWTSSRVDLDRALTAAASRPAWGLTRFSERRRLGLPTVPGDLSGVFPGLNEYELRREVSAVVAAMRRFADAPGRKILLLASGGWPSIDTLVSSRRTFGTDPEIQENDLDLVRPAIETANLLGFTVYPIDLPGYRDSTQTIVARSSELDTSWRAAAGSRETDPNVALPAGAVPQTFRYGQRNDSVLGNGYQGPESDLHREMLRQSTLRVVARDTGGRPLFGSARGKALSTVLDDTGSYYWLSFTPPAGDAGERHRIRVEVEGQGYRVRARRDYRESSPSEQASMVTLGAAMVRDSGSENELDIVLGTPRRAGHRKVEIPIRVEIPLDQVELVPRDGSFVANLELRLAAVDAVDRHTEIPIIPITLRREALPTAGEISSFETTVTLSRKARTLVLSLFDPIGGKVLLATSGL